jgi:hypothetical protein
MAHRKPLGTTCRTVADWEGETPFLLDYLVTTAGTWYRIIGMEEKANPKKLGLLLERTSPRTIIEVAEDDLIRWEAEGEHRHRVHPFEWYPRKKAAA